MVIDELASLMSPIVFPFAKGGLKKQTRGDLGIKEKSARLCHDSVSMIEIIKVSKLDINRWFWIACVVRQDSLFIQETY